MDTPTGNQTALARAVASALDHDSNAESRKARKPSPAQRRPSRTKGGKRSKSPDPTIFTSRNVVMQALLDAVNHGYTHHIHGSVPVSKLAQTVAVFDMNYAAFADRHERARRKRHGIGNVRALMLSRDDKVEWWLLATPPGGGKHPIHGTDNLSDAHQPEQRIEIDGYELARAPKPGSSASKLTWRMADRKYQGLRHYVIDTVRSRSHSRMHKMLYQLYATPGFAGIRSQVGKLVALYRSEVKRAGIKDAPHPPRHLYYLRRIPHSGVSARKLASNGHVG